jgi:purine-nucleoside phosphorylase
MRTSGLNPHGATAAGLSAEAVGSALAVTKPVAAIVLGSGLGALADRLTNARRVAYADVPGFHAPKVEGHKGELLCGNLGNREVLLLAGRFHMYEGHSAQASSFPVRVVRALGANTLFVSNAAGGINRTFKPGTLMVIRDHLNLQFRNPLIGTQEPGDIRFPDMSEAYSKVQRAKLHEAAKAGGLTLAEGVYAGLLGPTYETPSEVKMLATMGADAVGMSTVAETIVARAIGMEVAGVSCITNPAAGTSDATLDHKEVMEVGRQAASAFCGLVERWVAAL